MAHTPVCSRMIIAGLYRVLTENLWIAIRFVITTKQTTVAKVLP